MKDPRRPSELNHRLEKQTEKGNDSLLTLNLNFTMDLLTTVAAFELELKTTLDLTVRILTRKTFKLLKNIHKKEFLVRFATFCVSIRKNRIVEEKAANRQNQPIQSFSRPKIVSLS